MRTTRPHANSPFLSKLPALLAALPLLMLAACGGGEVFLQDGVNPGAGQNHSGGPSGPTGPGNPNGPGQGGQGVQSGPADPSNPRCNGPNCAQANDPVDPGDTRCKPGHTGPKCDVPRLTTDYLNNDPTQKLRDACKPAEREKASVKGRLWYISDNSDKYYTPYSYFYSETKELDPTSVLLYGLGNKKISLKAYSKKYDTVTCTDGWYAFTKEDHGDSITNVTVGYLILPSDVCHTNNCPTNWFHNNQNKASKPSKKVKILTFGGAISSTPEDLKKAGKLYPDKLKELASEIVDLEITNIAQEKKSYSKDWLVGKKDSKDKDLLKDKLIKGAKDSNLIVFTLGISEYFDDVYLAWDKSVVSKWIREKADEAIANIKKIMDVIRTANPNVTVVMLNYLDYSSFNTNIDGWVWLPANNELIKNALYESFIKTTKSLAGYKGLQVVDIFGKTKVDKQDLNQFVQSKGNITLNEKGHQLYAEQLFRVLGGWKSSSNELSDAKYVGYKKD